MILGDLESSNFGKWQEAAVGLGQSGVHGNDREELFQ